MWAICSLTLACSKSVKVHWMPQDTHLTWQGHPDTATLSAGHTMQTGNSLPPPGKLLPGAPEPKQSTDTADTRAIREESHLNPHHLEWWLKEHPKSCKDTTDSPSLYLPPKIHQHLDRTSGLLPRRAPRFTGIWWEQQLTRGNHVHTMTHNRSCGTQPAPRLRVFLLEKVTEDLKKP